MAEQTRHVVTLILVPHQGGASVLVPHRRVQMAGGTGFAHRPLGHEGDRAASQRRDLLDAVLVDHVPVRHLERVGEPQVDLVLAPAELTFRELDRYPRVVHVVAELPDHELVLAGLEDVVVHDVVRLGAHVLVALPRRLLERVLEEVELEFRAALHRVPGGPGPLHLTLEDLAGRHLHRFAGLLVEHVAQDERRLLKPRDGAHGGQVRLHGQVAVAGLPVGVRVPGERLHLHVHGQQVVAAVDHPLAPLEHVLHEVPPGEALAHEPALLVGEHHQDGVDIVAADQLGDGLLVQHAAFHVPPFLAVTRERGRGGPVLRPPRSSRPPEWSGNRLRRPFRRIRRGSIRRRSRGSTGHVLHARAPVPLRLGMAVLPSRHRELLLRRQHQSMPSGDGEVEDAQDVVRGDAVYAGPVGRVQEDGDQRSRSQGSRHDRAGDTHGAPVRAHDVRQPVAEQRERRHLEDVRDHRREHCHVQQRRNDLGTEFLLLQDEHHQGDGVADDRARDQRHVRRPPLAVGL